jgi:hypothetical protein
VRRGEFLICPAVISADMLFLPDWEGRMFTPVLPHFSEVFSPALSLAIQKCLIIFFRISRHHSIQDVLVVIQFIIENNLQLVHFYILHFLYIKTTLLLCNITITLHQDFTSIRVSRIFSVRHPSLIIIVFPISTLYVNSIQDVALLIKKTGRPSYFRTV